MAHYSIFLNIQVRDRIAESAENACHGRVPGETLHRAVRLFYVHDQRLDGDCSPDGVLRSQTYNFGRIFHRRRIFSTVIVLAWGSGRNSLRPKWISLQVEDSPAESVLYPAGRKTLVIQLSSEPHVVDRNDGAFSANLKHAPRHQTRSSIFCT